uniref:Uncharacterized protein n=1 Tax=Anguilla anguilla TaxID=7936 RepID=A0A0E9W770_ANGAN
MGQCLGKGGGVVLRSAEERNSCGELAAVVFSN